MGYMAAQINAYSAVAAGSVWRDFSSLALTVGGVALLIFAAKLMGGGRW